MRTKRHSRILPALVAALACSVGACINQGVDPDYAINTDLTLENATPLPAALRSKLEGKYIVQGKNARFGDTVIVKWGGGFLSMFCGTTTYAYTSGGFVDSTIVLIGYWRNAATLVGGQLQFSITDRPTLRRLLLPGDPPEGLVIECSVSDNVRAPTQGFTIRRVAPLPVPTRPFLIIGHRAGGRNSDYHPMSENTPGMARFSERLGANATEIDIRLTRDGVPIIFHDENISSRLVQQGSVVGPVSNYTFDQLRNFSRLVRGEPIPTLNEMLDSILERTSLEFVYLDVKTPDVMPLLPAIQDAYSARAAAMGRRFELVIALTTSDIQDAFRKLPDHLQRPSLNELTLDDYRVTNSVVWAPRWTQGTMKAEVAQVHAEGRRAITWTLDDPKFIKQYVAEGDFDGFLTNYPALVAYEYYMHGVK